MKTEEVPQNCASLALENFDVYMEDLFWIFFFYLFISYFMERNECLCGKSGLQSSLKGQKEEKKKRTEKKKKGPPSRKQSKTDEANLFTQSHRNGIENVQNTAQPACSLCFNGDESNFRLKDFLTFRERRGVSKLGPLLGYKGSHQGYWARIIHLRRQDRPMFSN